MLSWFITYDGQQEVGHRDPEGDREGQLERTPEALAHRQPQHDNRCYRGEGGPLQSEDEDGQKPGEAGGNSRLEDRQPTAPEAEGARAQTLED